jgi:hypothetical protein
MRTSYLGVALLVLGLVSVSVAGATHVDARQCRTVAGLSVTPVEEPPPDLRRVAYADLTGDQQQVFDQARGNRGALVQRGVFAESLAVDHEGEFYAVAVENETGCGDPFGAGVTRPLSGGVALVALGAGIARFGS